MTGSKRHEAVFRTVVTVNGRGVQFESTGYLELVVWNHRGEWVTS